MLVRPPLVVLIAGPNGAGKSTTAPRLLRGALAVSEFVNADTLALGLSAFRPDSVSLAAGRVMLERLHALAATRVDFAFETTLASRSFAPWLLHLRQTGFRSHLAFLSLSSPDLAVARVEERVRQGGHHVDEETVRRRFMSGLRNFFTVYQDLVDSWQMLDNADMRGLHLVATRQTGAKLAILDAPRWRNLREMGG